MVLVGTPPEGFPNSAFRPRLVMKGALANANRRVLAFRVSSLFSRPGKAPIVPPQEGIWQESRGEGIVP